MRMMRISFLYNYIFHKYAHNIKPPEHYTENNYLVTIGYRPFYVSYENSYAHAHWKLMLFRCY